MAISQRMDLRQAQNLVMTPQLQQAIKLLELSNQDLVAFVEQELERNPLLERGDEGRNEEPGPGNQDLGGQDSGGQDVAPADRSGDTQPSGGGEFEDTADFSQRETMTDERESPLDTDYDNTYHSEERVSGGNGTGMEGEGLYGGAWRTSGAHGGTDSEFSLEQTLTRAETLREHLERQLYLDIQDPTERLIGLQLIDMLNEAGYVAGDLAELADRLGCPLSQVEMTLFKLQRCDPCGVFARNLSECLALQLKERDRLDPAMQTLLDHLDLLARHDRIQLMKLCGIDAEDLADMVTEIRSLDPKPGASFETPEVEAVVPDILVARRPDGSWSVELNTDQLPRLLVNQQYHARVMTKNLVKAEKEYLNEHLASANWLLKTLHQRATTILKVASEIVRQQEAFLLHGVQHLRPLIRRDISEAIGMHESTVSRVTTNKFMATPRGLFELRYFFTASIPGANGGSTHSAESVRNRIRELIDNEGSEDILSDDRLVAILQSQGIDIARRTVAKYRESLKISSSVHRRREKALRSG